MVTIKIDDVCKIEGDLEHSVLRYIDDNLSFEIPGAKYIPYYGSNWDGKKRLLNNDLTFDYGLLRRVTGLLKENNIEYVIEDNRFKSDIESLDISKNLTALGKKPRPYQIEAANKVFDHDCGIVRMATGSGKCNSENSLHITEYGLLNYKELLDGFNIKEEEAINFKIKVATPLTEDLNDESSMIYCDGYSESNKIKTRFGYTLTCTPDHKIKIINNDGNIVWKKSSDLKKGDYAVLSPNTQMFGDLSIPEDEAYWYGLLLGDGGFTTKNRIVLTNMDEHILSFSEMYLKNNSINFSIKKSKSKAYDILINSKNYKQKLINDGFKECYSHEKTIPLKFRKLSKKPLRMLIRGLYETDGWVDKNCSVCIGLSSEELIDQLHLILLNYGIVASKRVKKTTHRDFYILTIYRTYVNKFNEEIGFDPKGHKFKKLNNILAICGAENTNTDVIPHQNIKLKKIIDKLVDDKVLNRQQLRKTASIRSWVGPKAWRKPSRKKLSLFLSLIHQKNVEVEHLQELCSNKYYFDQIVSIDKVQSYNYDFVIPKTHSFVSQGFINHNTLTSALMVSNLNKKTIFYVIGTDLLHQTYGFFKKVFTDHKVGIIGDGYCNIGDINVASVWTIGCALGMKKNKIVDETDDEEKVEPEKYKDIKVLLKEAKVHILDECHAAACSTIQEIAKVINPEYIYGMSASPWRDDNSDLLIEAILGNRIIDISASYLIERNYLVQPNINFIKVPKMRVKRHYQTVYSKYIIENESRNKLILDGTKKLIDLGYKPLVLYDKLSHGKILHNMLSKDIKCAILSGKDNQNVRDSAKSKIESGEIDCILASKIFDIGVDIPILSGLVAAGAGKSSVRALQRIGRVIRPYEGKNRAAVLEFYDDAHYVRDHSRQRYKIYQKEEGFKVKWPKI